jgi:rhamnose utilization protein RhaD (predicted bifunctional aldolase and dehydrogenase)
MQNLWDTNKAKNYTDDLALRVYTSNLLGQSDALVLHGGGNTSVKSKVKGEDILFVKGSGWDLVSIQAQGFAPVRLEALEAMAKLEHLSDTDMVAQQKAAMIRKDAPNPSVEAILHAIVPFKFVDHTHADSVVTITNSKDGAVHIKKLFPNFLIVPYVMPGFILAQTIYQMTQDFDWSSCEGIILMHHGIFTFDDDAKKSYDKMIAAVTKAEDFLNQNAPLTTTDNAPICFDTHALAKLVAKEKTDAMFTNVNTSSLALTYASQNDLNSFASRGVLTPEHIIRTKRAPLIVLKNDCIQTKIAQYKSDYIKYFNTFATDETMLNPAPNYAVIEGFGTVSFGKSQKEADIVNDIVTHTMEAVLKADKLGGYKSIGLQESFAMEYWELEQNKLKK